MSRLLLAAHLRAIKRMGLRLSNLGWVVTEDAYLSKISVGVLETRRLGKGKYVHFLR